MSELERVVELMRADPFIDDAHLLGTTQQDMRMLHYATIAIAAIDEARHEASEAVGAWLSAALDDPAVCEAMKADIRRWFDAGQLLPAPPKEVG
jgi:hypothetical protein